MTDLPPTLKSAAKRAIRAALELLPARLKAFLVQATFSSLPRPAQDAHRRNFQMADVAWSLRGLRKRGFVPDLVIDVQGYELEVHKGASRILGEAGAVLMETSLVGYNRGAPQVADVVRFMDEHGFCIYDICSMIRASSLTGRPDDDTLVQTDLLFVRKESPLRPAYFEFPPG